MAAKRKLAAYVHVAGQVFEPGDSPDKEFAEQITNPKAWADGSAPEGEVPVAYEDMDPAQLKAAAKDKGVEVKRGMSDAELIEALRKADADGSAPQ